jgi:hypothetical protein
VRDVSQKFERMALLLERIRFRIGSTDDAQCGRLKLDALTRRGRCRELAVHFHARSGRRLRELALGDHARAQDDLQIAKTATVTELEEVHALPVSSRLDPAARRDAPPRF